MGEYQLYWIGSGKSGRVKPFRPTLTDIRAQTTCKTAAFCAPRWTLFNNYLVDYIGPTDREEKLCTAYESRGRRDLADCVRGGRVHNLLAAFLSEDVFGVTDKFPEQFHALVIALDPDSPDQLHTGIREWQVQRENSHPNDPSIKRMWDSAQRAWRSRSESRLVYPVQRFVSQLWKRCRKAFGRYA